MKVSMRIEGGAELAKTLNALSDRMSKKVMRDALEVAGEPIRKGMQVRAPRAPGAPDIADNIIISNARVDSINGSGNTSAVAIGPRKGFYYGRFLEYGTIHNRAQPFMRPAFESGVAKAISELIRATWTILAGQGISRSVTKDTPVDGGGPLL